MQNSLQKISKLNKPTLVAIVSISLPLVLFEWSVQLIEVLQLQFQVEPCHAGDWVRDLQWEGLLASQEQVCDACKHSFLPQIHLHFSYW